MRVKIHFSSFQSNKHEATFDYFLLEHFSIVCKRFVSLHLFIYYCHNHERYLGLVTQAPDYVCSDNSRDVKFTLSVLDHSGENLATNCSVSKCAINASSVSSCRSSSTPCFDYRTFSNISVCAPAVDCSILASCDNITKTCTSNTSVCIVNSCCSQQAVCLPLSSTTFCSTGGEFYTCKK